MLELSDVTLVMVETRDFALARLTLLDALDKIKFGDVLICTNSSAAFGIDNCRYVKVEDWQTKLEWCQYIWYEMPRHVHTSHMLLLQWDAGVWDTNMWRNEYMQYDLIGAPWWYKSKNVGNTGFALKSSRLARYIMDRAWEFYCDTPAEDNLLCRHFRPALEDRGFIWAPDSLAHEFAVECCRPSQVSRHFGYHAMSNWPTVLPYEQVMGRLKLVMESESLRDSFQAKSFRQQHPKTMQESLKRTGIRYGRDFRLSRKATT